MNTAQKQGAANPWADETWAHYFANRPGQLPLQPCGQHHSTGRPCGVCDKRSDGS